MTQDNFKELSLLVLYDITKYMSENDEIDLENSIRNYITRENRTIELKLTTDAKHFTNIILSILKDDDYFELSQKAQNTKLYRLTENGKLYFRRMEELRGRQVLF